MGQQASRALPLHAAPPGRRAAAAPPHVLVDLDNIAFRAGAPDYGCMLRRVESLRRALPGATMHFACNQRTFADLRRHGFPYLRHVTPTPNAPDAADHALVRTYLGLVGRASDSHASVVVVTHDKTFARLVRYHAPERALADGRLRFATFGAACGPPDLHDHHRFALAFNDRADLDAFMASLARFRGARASSTRGRPPPPRSRP